MCPQRMRSLLGQRVPELWAPCCLCQELGGKPRQCLVTYLQKAIFAVVQHVLALAAHTLTFNDNKDMGGHTQST